MIGCVVTKNARERKDGDSEPTTLMTRLCKIKKKRQGNALWRSEVGKDERESG